MHSTREQIGMLMTLAPLKVAAIGSVFITPAVLLVPALIATLVLRRRERETAGRATRHSREHAFEIYTAGMAGKVQAQKMRRARWIVVPGMLFMFGLLWVIWRPAVDEVAVWVVVVISMVWFVMMVPLWVGLIADCRLAWLTDAELEEAHRDLFPHRQLRFPSLLARGGVIGGLRVDTRLATLDSVEFEMRELEHDTMQIDNLLERAGRHPESREFRGHPIGEFLTALAAASPEDRRYDVHTLDVDGYQIVVVKAGGEGYEVFPSDVAAQLRTALAAR